MEIIQNKGLDLLMFNAFPKGNLFNFSTTIHGGASTGTYASLNLSPYSGDDPESVNENQEHLANIIGISVENLYLPYQTHNDRIQIIDEAFLYKSDLEKASLMNGVDALITDRKDICIGVTTADCVPILIYDTKRHILAAVHAGWKGTVAKIVRKTILKMMERFDSNPKHLLAGIGPCISQKHFEVGEEVVEAFIQAGFSIGDIAYRNHVSGKMHINLEAANGLLLAEAGIPIGNIEKAGLCTYSNPELLFSARRQTIHSGRIVTGGILL
ncbi:peptidoglycan editing factor PgeF [Dysgonomonas sp. 521]|uniref:peptidoglycan editing factor PgeF n=1 Tax=Dysgonomonas sp. 521 TaxID=2302932 RepID=UPI0013D167DB|nr:peptidoglycan editing factor PgeF [Dysgonomonas sp. 521]NDV94716.1 peptidoglycan editing factor PgeF [Dysgonomonas sp. 521]